MENRKDHIGGWQFFGIGFAVCFIVMVVLWYNERDTATKLKGWLDYKGRMMGRMNIRMNDLNRENDSLFRANDSLQRQYVYIQFDSSSSKFIGTMQMHVPKTVFDSIISSKNKP